MNTTHIRRFRQDELRDIEQQNHARKLVDLPTLVVKVRTCMVCNSVFESVGRRICCEPATYDTDTVTVGR